MGILMLFTFIDHLYICICVLLCGFKHWTSPYAGVGGDPKMRTPRIGCLCGSTLSRPETLGDLPVHS